MTETTTHLFFRSTEQQPGAGVEDGVRGGQRRCDLLGDLVPEVFDDDLVGALVQDGKPVAGDEDGRVAEASFGVLRMKEMGGKCASTERYWLFLILRMK